LGLLFTVFFFFLAPVRRNEGFAQRRWFSFAKILNLRSNEKPFVF
jgi:hypothetical protein